MRKPVYNALPMMLGMMMAMGEGRQQEEFKSVPPVEQDLYQRKPFESKTKLKKRSGSKKPRSKRK